MNGVENREKVRVQLRAFERGGQVVRFHTVPQLHPQNLAAHSYGVAWLCWVLTEGKASAALFYAALVHDVPEFKIGDVPSQTKDLMDTTHAEQMLMHDHQLPLPALAPEEARVLFLADQLEGLRQCVHERQLGNRLVAESYRNYERKCERLVRTDVERFVFNHYRLQWSTTCS